MSSQTFLLTAERNQLIIGKASELSNSMVYSLDGFDDVDPAHVRIEMNESNQFFLKDPLGSQGTYVPCNVNNEIITKDINLMHRHYYYSFYNFAT